MKIGNLPELIMPFVTAYTQAGNMGLSCCNYNATGGVVDFGIANGNFHERVGGNEGDAITVTVYQKHGYKEIFDLIPSVYKMERADFATDEIYANFREVKTTGMKSGILYRSSNPLNLKKNPGRYIYVDKLAEKVGVKTEIDLADTENDVKEYIASADYKANYCKTLFENGNTVTLGMSADVFSKDFMAKAARGFRFMIEHEGPYLVHCNEGKDRCGFIIMLLEGLSGATINELRSDYMVTFENYYNMQPGTKSYDTNLLLTGDRNIWVLANPKVLNDYININWNAMSLNGINLQQSVINYMKDCGLNTDEISQLKARLTK
ncbi:MAG: tyrosine-protein phosphatase [Bacteroidaceae bacterium]|nr:tyrosine-protein phosphatase [Bacteroidaceae bacterium]